MKTLQRGCGESVSKPDMSLRKSGSDTVANSSESRDFIPKDSRRNTKGFTNYENPHFTKVG
jgi:hypothetical protein